VYACLEENFCKTILLNLFKSLNLLQTIVTSNDKSTATGCGILYISAPICVPFQVGTDA